MYSPPECSLWNGVECDGGVASSCLDEWVRLPLFGELPVMFVVVEMMMLVLGLNFDRYWYLDRLHNRLRVHVRVMLDRNVDPNPAQTEETDGEFN